MAREKFFVLGLPRSRTYWLSRFLSTPTCVVEHEAAMHYDSLDALHAGMKDGMCDTSLLLRWKDLKGKIVLIERPAAEVEESLNRLYPNPRRKALLTCAWDALQEAKRSHHCIQYDDLRQEAVCQWLFEHLTEERFDRLRWKELDQLVLVADQSGLMSRMAENYRNLLKLLEGCMPCST